MPDVVNKTSKTPKGSKEPPSKGKTVKRSAGVTAKRKKSAGKLKATATKAAAEKKTSPEVPENSDLKTAGTPAAKTPINRSEENSVDKKRKSVVREQTKTKRSGKGEDREGNAKDKQINVHLAKIFFKYMHDKQNAMGRTEDGTVEMIPDANSLTTSMKAMRKKKPSRQSKYKPDDKNLFKENGDPVWIYVDRKEPVEMADGVTTKHPELLEALTEDKREPEDIKQWTAKIGKIDDAQLLAAADKEIPEFDPFAPVEVLAERTELYYDYPHVEIATMYNLWSLSAVAVDRFFAEGAANNHERVLQAEKTKVLLDKWEKEERTCVVTSIEFHLEGMLNVSYDRRRPIKSIRKLRKKQRKLRMSGEETPMGSREKTSKEKSKGSQEIPRSSTEKLL